MSKNIKYLDIDEQIEHLINKGLVITNKETAKSYLGRIGYYKLINGYRAPFTYKIVGTNKNYTLAYYENTSIDDLYHLYCFDQDLKGLLLKNISHIEIMVKSRMSDVISQNYGINEDDYLNPNNFKPDNQNVNLKSFKDIREDIINTIKKQSTKHNSIKWYTEKYGYHPFWIVSNILTLGTISLLYSKMKQPDQYKISNWFRLKSKFFESLLMIMQLFRNACAHNEIVYNYKTLCSLSQNDINEIYNLYKIEKNNKTGKYINGTNDVFAIIIIFKLLLTKDQFSDFLSQLDLLLNRLKKQVDEQKYKSILFNMGIVGSLDIIKEWQPNN